MTITEAFEAIADIQSQLDGFNPELTDVSVERRKLEYKRILIEQIQADIQILLLQRQLSEMTPPVATV